MDYFIDKTCTIYDTTIVNIRGSDTKSYTAVYTSQPCDFYPNTGTNRFLKTNEARETEQQSYEVVLLWNKNLCERGQKISILDNNSNDLWNYLIEDVSFYPDITWEIDNTTLQSWGSDDTVIDNVVLAYSPLFIRRNS